jgi:hypothetical protein
MEQALASYPGGSFKKPPSIQFAETPYGNIPFSVDSLRENVLESIRNSVMINGQEHEMPQDYYPADYGQNDNNAETNIDFILNQ